MIGRAAVLAAAIVVAVVWSDAVGEAHKPITSSYTFAEHAGPIFRARCGSCHAPGQVAPMSLLTHEEAMPWAESIRLELMAGHMPPWGIVSPAARFRGSTLTASELNTLLVWAAGGTPPGAAAGLAVEPAVESWRLGVPDAVLEVRLQREREIPHLKRRNPDSGEVATLDQLSNVAGARTQLLEDAVHRFWNRQLREGWIWFRDLGRWRGCRVGLDGR